MPCSTRIMDSAINGHILMQCANEHCGFRVDLTDIYHTSFFTSTYEELPTLVANPQPDMTLIYTAFCCLPPNPHDIAPYFNGYLGSHVSVWPDFQQLCGLSIGVALYLLKRLLLLLEDWSPGCECLVYVESTPGPVWVLSGGVPAAWPD
ncbi:uncharacterized protein BJ212DRAFT_1298131 [Suillus subaureus]|uniref:Uncharacterized protein n=1 Tax=Suillus subaureus TaxID=48587 RepID=A0A9P7EEP7_9AGAM|nr:uncharacterized protein BJ212DRAFT_1298131 [Suillus subaureus]KAG1819693.1 hypothetical protein BJ212DRAFT_1298131 [Suillus subaureus]